MARATLVHGARYDYGLVQCTDSRTPVIIVCGEHGPFEQSPGSHLYGRRGCPRCGRARQIAAISQYDSATFAAAARRVHGDRYRYDRVVFAGLRVKVDITCADHGDFRQAPGNHLHAGAGCPACGAESARAKTSLSQDEFEQAVERMHGEQYDLREAAYHNAMQKVLVTCRTHGPFTITPNALLRGKGCRACGYEKRQRTRESFIAEATELFDGRYDYADVPEGPIPTRARVTIVCPRHGRFAMPAGRHLLGAGCAACHESRAERQIRQLLTNAGVTFIPQWGHPTLRRRMPLRFDFALPATATLIEFDGDFHHRPVQMPGQTARDAERVHRDTIERDQIKDRWAADNGWRLIRLTDRASIEHDLQHAGVLPAAAEASR